MNDEYLLTGKLYCGKCGSPMMAQTGTGRSGKKFNYYACNRRRYEHACDKKNEPQSPLEASVIEAVRAELMDDATIGYIVDGYSRAVALVKADRKKEALESELADVNKEIDNFLKAIGAGIFNELTQQRLDELRDARAELEDAIRLEDAAERLPEPEEVGSWLCSLREGDWTDRAFIREIIKKFVLAVYVFDDKMKVEFSYGTTTEQDIDLLTDDSDAEDAEGISFSTSSDMVDHSFRREHRFYKRCFVVTYPRKDRGSV